MKGWSERVKRKQKARKRQRRTAARASPAFYNRRSLLIVASCPGWSESLMPTVEPSAPTVTPAAVRPGSFLTLHYRMADAGGADIINTFGGKPATLSLGSGQLSPAIEQRLMGLPEGTRATFELAAGEAFGQRNPELVQWVRASCSTIWVALMNATASATWCSFRPLTAWASTPARCGRFGGMAMPSSSTSTIR